MNIRNNVMKITLLIYIFLFCIHMLAGDKDFFVKLNPDYYNPFACSFEWQIFYSGQLSKNQYINLHVEIYDRELNKQADSFDMNFIPGRNKVFIYFFISTNSVNTEMSFRS